MSIIIRNRRIDVEVKRMKRKFVVDIEALNDYVASVIGEGA